MYYYNKYKYYKHLYKKLIKGGRCRPFSTKDCEWNSKYNKCSCGHICSDVTSITVLVLYFYCILNTITGCAV